MGLFSVFFLAFRFVKLLFSCAPFKVYLKVNIFVMCAGLMQKCPLKISKNYRIIFIWNTLNTPPNSEIICGQNVGTKVVCGMILFFEKKAMLKIWKKLWVPFRSYLLNSTANPAQFECKWAGLAVLFSR